MKLEQSLTPHKNNLKMDYRPKCKTGHYKTLRRKHRKNTLWHKSQQVFFDPPPRVMEIKTKISRWDLMKLQSFCTAKKTINKTKRQPSEWEKIFANESTDKGLISKEDIQMVDRHMKRCSTSLTFREMQIKTTMRYYLTPVKTVSSKRTKILLRIWRKGDLHTLLVEM